MGAAAGQLHLPPCLPCPPSHQIHSAPLQADRPPNTTKELQLSPFCLSPSAPVSIQTTQAAASTPWTPPAVWPSGAQLQLPGPLSPQLKDGWPSGVSGAGSPDTGAQVYLWVPASFQTIRAAASALLDPSSWLGPQGCPGQGVLGLFPRSISLRMGMRPSEGAWGQSRVKLDFLYSLRGERGRGWKQECVCAGVAGRCTVEGLGAGAMKLGQAGLWKSGSY